MVYCAECLVFCDHVWFTPSGMSRFLRFVPACNIPNIPYVTSITSTTRVEPEIIGVITLGTIMLKSEIF